MSKRIKGNESLYVKWLDAPKDKDDVVAYPINKREVDNEQEN